MKQKTKNLLHRTYEDSVVASSNIIEIIENLHHSLTKVSNIPDEDQSLFDGFLKGVYTSKMIRHQTFEMTNLATDIATVMMHISIWLHSTQNINVDINITARRKALETELEKLLDKPVIHDRFGLRGIILNNTSPQESLDMLFQVADFTINILTRENRAVYNQFFSWVENNENIDDPTKVKIKFILNLPFRVDLIDDYIKNPKPNGYQSLHFNLSLEMFSHFLPGAEFEIQFRTYKMHQTASSGSASGYEENRRSSLKNIFTINDFSKVNVIGFTGYNSPDDDIDGIHFHKVFVNRRISSSLV